MDEGVTQIVYLLWKFGSGWTCMKVLEVPFDLYILHFLAALWREAHNAWKLIYVTIVQNQEVIEKNKMNTCYLLTEKF